MTSLSERQQEAATMPTYADYRKLIPPLTANLHKGQGGRIGIIGGSADYTGAPYFSGMAALRLGADLCHIICDEDAATAIKSYTPDFIVHPYIKIRATSDLAGMDEKKIRDIWAQTFDDIGTLLKRLHVLVVGPGLSRDKKMLQCAKHAIEKAKELDMPIVIDADGLFLVQNEPDLVQGYTKAVLTPNIVEFGRLCSAKDIDAEDQDLQEPAVLKLSKAFGGVIIIQKGSVDAISDGKSVHAVSNEGGLKRSGGQGDILTGLLATSLGWALTYSKDSTNQTHPAASAEKAAMTACFGACVINRECSRLAYQKHKRSVQSSDVIKEIGPFFITFYDKARPNAQWGEAIYG
ncbi:hypothetical protein BX616_005634 [Lobosporangium transversale]|uniref:ATP-dependent (S)-NAD(P)H-hydrate dehydratase n=1 Tax=Lobosporangium transversale TaxID=64571 RepID=A0A1Y2GB15_9FUNG|nr:Ribokinase-like protein [Lobosporangium transversale]KAF9915668.1 hypothetical protein BX616_005634 [Lobosporangium transversale]ORZ04868.1 Ribokinase-like protein [Lobosporangium transversale]|eukprot:XP_021876805.1 Ribokinase-like protein [Lobosporangium transversale]